MKNFWNYVEKHTWAQLAVVSALVFTFFGIVETVYPAIHGGETIQDAFMAWMRQG
jgi:hypothetical protein